MNQIVGINNTFQSYQKLIDFYEVNKDKEFDDIYLTIAEWFSTNMCCFGWYFRYFI